LTRDCNISKYKYIYEDSLYCHSHRPHKPTNNKFAIATTKFEEWARTNKQEAASGADRKDNTRNEIGWNKKKMLIQQNMQGI